MASKTGLKLTKSVSTPKRKAGLREIASAANVSIATASRVLSGNNKVDPAIRKAVWREAEKLGIDPSVVQLPRPYSLDRPASAQGCAAIRSDPSSHFGRDKFGEPAEASRAQKN